MTQKQPVILKHNDSNHADYDEQVADDGTDDLDKFDDELQEEEKKADDLGGLGDAETTDDDEDGNY